VVAGGCCDTITYHRGATLPINGAIRVAERYAIDLVQLDDKNKIASGPIDKLSSYAFPWPVLPKVSASPAMSRSTLQMGEAAIRNGSVIQSRAQAALNRTESFASRHGTTRSSRCSR
jgi:hypothetical protein